MSAWQDFASAPDGALDRSVFYFDDGAQALYASVYRGSGELGLGLVLCDGWSLESLRSFLPRDLASAVAARGGSAFLFHYPGTGDSFGTIAEVGIEELRRAAVAAVAEAQRRDPDVRWVLAGFSIGAAVAALAAAEAGVDALLLLEPALDPRLYAELTERQARRVQLERSEEGFFWGQPLPRLRDDDPSPIAALDAFAGEAHIIRSAEAAPETPLPAGVVVRTVPGAFLRKGHAPEVVDAAVEWLAALPAAPAAPRESRAAAGTDGIVVEHPVLIPTGSGLIGGVVSEPADIPVAAQLMFLHGAGDPRAGVNAHWSRTTRGLAALGYQVVRLDWAQTWESHSALPDGPIQDRKVPLPELVAWFRAHDEGRPFVLLGSCFGADAAAELAPDLHDLQALGLIVPLLAAPKRFVGRLKNGLRAPAWKLGPRVAAGLEAALERMPVWILAGGLDGDYSAVLNGRRGRRGARPEVRTVAGVQLHAFRGYAAQQIAHEEILAWGSKILERLDADPERTLGLEPAAPGPPSASGAGPILRSRG